MLCVRHGTSIANEFMAQPGNTWGEATFRDDETLIDAQLSSNGIDQVKTELQYQLQNQYLDFLRDELQLVIISPLTRCLQTYEYGVRPVLLSLLKQQEKGKNVTVVSSSSSKVNTLALPLMAERVYTASDTGRSVATLSNKFPFVDFSECSNTSVAINPSSTVGASSSSTWWYSSTYPESEEWRPYGEGQWYAVPGEPEGIFEKRMKRFDDWIRDREEISIVLVAHWGVFHHLTDGVEWKNGEAKMLDWTYDTKTGKSSISLRP